MAAAAQSAAAARTAGGRASAVLSAEDTRRDDDFWVVRHAAQVGGPGAPALGLARFSDAAELLEERYLEIPSDRIVVADVAVDREGRTWMPVAAHVPDEVEDPEEWAARVGFWVRVYDADGTFEREIALDGDDFLGPSPTGSSRPLALHWDHGPRLVEVDPATAARRELVRFREAEFGGPGGGCLWEPRSVQAADDGSFYVTRDHSGGIGRGWSVVRRYDRSGVLAENWRLPLVDWHSSARAGDAVLVITGDRVHRLEPGEPAPVEWHPGRPVTDVASLGRGAVALLDEGRRLRLLAADGSLGPLLTLDLPPTGMTFAAWDRLRADLARTDDLSTRQLLELLLVARDEAADQARRRLLALGGEAAEPLLAAVEEWGWEPRLASLAVELAEGHPENVGGVFTRHLADRPGPALERHDELLATYLVHGWENPSPGFVDLLARPWQTPRGVDEDDPLYVMGLLVFSAQFPFYDETEALPAARRAPGDRFPAPSPMVDYFLFALGPEDGRPDDAFSDLDWAAEDFFFHQFARVATAFDDRLTDVAHPQHARVVEELEGFLSELERREAATGPGLGDAGAELVRLAAGWRTHPSREVSHLGDLLAVALGDASALDGVLALACSRSPACRPTASALVALLRQQPEGERVAVAGNVVAGLRGAPPPLLRAVLPAVVETPDPTLLARLTGWILSEDLAEETRCIVQAQLSADGVWPALPTAALERLIEAGELRGHGCGTSGYRFADRVWRRLTAAAATAPAARGAELLAARDLLESRVADTLATLLAAEVVWDSDGPDWFTLLNQAPETGLSRQVPTEILRRLTRHLPANEYHRPRALTELARVAAVRGPWPELLDELESALSGTPQLLVDLPDGAADRWLGRHRVNQLVLAPPP